jgi:DNA replication protein DnaC
MISPSAIDPDKFIQQDEKSILERFLKSEIARNEDEFVFHSVRYQNHPNKIIGEVDFIFVDREVILFLEVKSGVSYDPAKNSWTSYYDRYHKVKKDPWQQVADYLFWFRDDYLTKKNQVSHLHDKFKFGYGVIFPDVQTHKDARYEKVKFKQFGKKNGYGDEYLEYNPELIYDIQDHSNERTGIDNYIRRIADYWKSHSANKYRGYGPVSDEDLYALTNLIRREIIVEPKLSTLIDFDLELTQNLTSSQTKLYSAMVDGPNRHNVIVQGGPGTGKTILALEVAFSKAQKGKTLLLCYSRPLSKLLIELKRKGIVTGQLKMNIEENLDVFCLDDFIERMGITHETLFNGENQLKKALSKIERKSPAYNFVVIDEAQDIFNQVYFQIINMSLKDGFSDGGNCIFLDRDFQLLHKEKFDEEYYSSFLEEFNPYIFPPLEVNCRNPKPIMESASGYTGFEKMECLKETGLKPELEYYSDTNDLIKNIAEYADKLISEEVQLKNISIIVPNTVVLSELLKKNDKIVNINFSSILESEKIKAGLPEDFKGLDNSIVLYVSDEFRPENELFNASLFVAFSRAKTTLRIYFPEEKKDLINQTFLKNFLRQ